MRVDTAVSHLRRFRDGVRIAVPSAGRREEGCAAWIGPGPIGAAAGRKTDRPAECCLDAEHHVTSELRFGREQWRDHAMPDELLVHRVGFDVLGEELNGGGPAAQPVHGPDQSV
jgi:hypothetical protein